MKSQASRETREKPDGGYCSIPTHTLGLLWWALSEGLIGSRAVRVGLALFELRLSRLAYVWTERKAGRGTPEFTPHYAAGELASLCGLPEKRVRAALLELEELGLLEFSPESVRFARTLAELKLSPAQRAAFVAWSKDLTKRRRIPVPRRALVLAAESSSRALIATILGVCLRCSWVRPGEGCSFSGRVSFQWLARRFRLSIRAVQGAKEHLVGLGWLARTGNINRFGEVVAINPAWERLQGTLPRPVPVNGDQEPAPVGPKQRAGGPDPGTKSAGVERPAGTKSAGVSFIQESPLSEEIQNPRRASPAAPAAARSGPGVLISDQEKKSKNQDPPDSELLPPRLSAIRPEDFRSTERALELFRQAVKCRLMPGSEHARLLWMAAIERARTVPARNPAGVFLHLVKNRKWDYLSEAHFEAANRRLKAHLWGPPETPLLGPVGALGGPVKSPARRAALSRDALLVQVVRGELARRGLRGDPFHALRAQAGWTRERYESALAELEKRSTVAAI